MTLPNRQVFFHCSHVNAALDFVCAFRCQCGWLCCWPYKNVAVHSHSTTGGIRTAHTDRSAFPSRSIHSSPEKLEASIGRKRSVFACLSLPASIHLAFPPSPSPPRPAPRSQPRFFPELQYCCCHVRIHIMISYGGDPPLCSFVFDDLTRFPSSHPRT